MTKCCFLTVLWALTLHGQSLSCTLQDATIASNEEGRLTIEKTTINWKRAEYHIVGKAAVLMVYKDVADLGTKVNPLQRDELLVLENTPTRIVMMSSGVPGLTLDVIFPKAGNGYGYYVSDYGGALGSFNAAKLYLLKCKDISTVKN